MTGWEPWMEDEHHVSEEEFYSIMGPKPKYHYGRTLHVNKSPHPPITKGVINLPAYILPKGTHPVDKHRYKGRATI